MNARIRTIKPEILEDAVTGGLSDMAFRIFIAVIVLADDYGRFRAEPGWLRSQIYWSRDVTLPDFIAALADLDPLVRLYQVNGQRYGEIRKWAKHQKVDRPGKPRIPAPIDDPPESVARPSRESRECAAMVSRDPPESPAKLPVGLATDHGPWTMDQGPGTTDPDRPRACAREGRPPPVVDSVEAAPEVSAVVAPAPTEQQAKVDAVPASAVESKPARAVVEANDQQPSSKRAASVEPNAQANSKQSSTPIPIPIPDLDSPNGESRSARADAPERPCEGPPVGAEPEKKAVCAMPDWFSESVATVEITTGRKVDDVPSRWLEYSAARTRKGWSMGVQDAAAWLTTVMRSERSRTPARSSSRHPNEITKQPYDPAAPWLKDIA
ncbi:MAG: hypothetical protein FWD73_06995 [Polyangiaceae bacterium]|nr:hypothetical protein [Polyangiaceae bacterium]